MGAGALGFSTSRTLLHRVPDGRLVPGTWADERELLAIADVLGRHGKGVYEVAPRFERPGAELRRHARRGALDGRDQPAHRAAGHVRARAEQRRPRALPRDPRARRRGRRSRRRAPAADDRARHRPAVRSAAPHVLRPRAGVGRAPAAAARRAARGARRRPSAGPSSCGAAEANTPPLDWRGVYVLTARRRRLLRRSRDLARRARRARPARRSPRRSCASRSRPAAGRSSTTRSSTSGWTRSRSSSTTPAMAIGLGDSGAHVGLIMDASLPTWFLLHWVRDRQKYTIEDAIRRLTSDTAALFGIADRGVLRPGAFADVNVIDLDGARARAPRVRPRLPDRRRPLRATVRGYRVDDRQRRGVRRARRRRPARTRVAPCGRDRLQLRPTRRPRRASIAARSRPLASRGSCGPFGCGALMIGSHDIHDPPLNTCKRARAAPSTEHAPVDARIPPGSRRPARDLGARRPRRSTTTSSVGTSRASRPAASSASRCSSSSAAT